MPKISQLPVAASANANDLLAIVNIASGTTRKITWTNLLAPEVASRDIAIAAALATAEAYTDAEILGVTASLEAYADAGDAAVTVAVEAYADAGIAAHVIAVGAHTAARISPTTTTNRAVSDADTTLQLALDGYDNLFAGGPGWTNMFGEEMKHFRKACANIASQRVNIHFVGDSTHAWTASTYTNSLVYRAFERLCRANNQPAPLGFVPLCSTTSGAYPGRVWAPLTDVTDRSLEGWGYTNSSVPTTAAPTITATCTSARIWYPTFVSLVGAFKWQFDATLSGNITQSTGTHLGGRVTASESGTRGSHTVAVIAQNGAFPSVIEGVEFFDGNETAGFQLYDGGHFGYRSSHFAAASASGSWFTDGVDNANPDLVIIHLGINDRTAAVAVATMRANIAAQITQWTAACAAAAIDTPSFLVCVTYDTGDPASVPDTYEIALFQAAHDAGAAFISFKGLFGAVGSAALDVETLTADNTHPNTVGHRVLGDQLGMALIDAAAFPQGVDGPYYVATPRTLDPDSTMAANSDNVAASQKATKTALALKAPIDNPTFTTGITTPKETISGTDGTGAITSAAQTAAPAVASAGFARLFVETICGRDFYFIRGANGIALPVEPARWAKSYVEFRPTTGTGFSTWGSFTANGTVSTPAMTEAQGPITQFAGAASSAALAGLQTANTEFLRGSAAPRSLIPSGANGAPQLFNGFWFHCKWFPVDASYDNTGVATGSRIFAGLSNQTALVTTATDDPVGHRCGFSRIHVNGLLNDATIFFSTKDGATESRVNTTMAWAAQNQYEMWIYCPGGGATITWRVDNLTAGTSREGTTALNVPGASTLMRAMCMEQTVDAVARNMQVDEFYVETCR